MHLMGCLVCCLVSLWKALVIPSPSLTLPGQFEIDLSENRELAQLGIVVCFLYRYHAF